MHLPLRLASAFSVSLACVATGWLMDGKLPARTALDDRLTTEPTQTQTDVPAFDALAGGVRYRITPVFEYDISGLVVSLHHSDAWWDWIHAASNDHLNVVDLCVVWGANAASGAYTRMHFSSGQFVCYFSTEDPSAWRPEYVRALSNNHLLTDDTRVARRLQGLRVGDQIRLRGQLSEYSHNAGFAFTRGTSITRDDTGNGACETIFVREVSLLRRAPAWPRWLFRLGLLLTAASIALWLAQPHRARD